MLCTVSILVLFYFANIFSKSFWNIASGCKSSRNNDDDDADKTQQLDETEHGMVREHGRESNRGNKPEEVSVPEDNFERTRLTESVQREASANASSLEALKTGSNEEKEIISIGQCEANMTDLENKIRKLKQPCSKELTTKCYQLKIHRTTDDDCDEVVHEFFKSIDQLVLDKIELVMDQWRTLDLWELVRYVNPRPVIKFQNEILQRSNPLPDKHQDSSITFRRSIVLCCIFEDLMKNFGWKVGDALDIENDICDIVVKLMMQMTEPDISSLLDCMQISMMNIQTYRSRNDNYKFRSLLITKKKYNGSNLACILLEQMILDNKDNNVSWMRTVCTQFVDLVCQLVIEPDYQEDVHWTLNYLMKLEPYWTVADIYNLIRNGILTFQYRQAYFHRYLMKIRNFAIHPTLNIRLANKSLVCLNQVLESRDEDIWKCFDNEIVAEEQEKSLEQVLMELKDEEVGQEEKHSVKQIIERSKIIQDHFTEPNIARELDRIKNGVDVLSSCLAATSMSLFTCKQFWPSNTQLVSYCLLVARRTKTKGRLLEILTGEGKSCVIAMVAATYALLGRTVDIVTSSPVLSQRDADEWRTFYKTLGLDVDCNVDDNRGDDSQCYKCPIVYGTVETFARDILKTEFQLQAVRKERTFDIVIVDEVDSMLIDQGVQFTYLSYDIGSLGMRHFEPILALIWMNLSMFSPVRDETQNVVYYVKEPEVFLVTLSYLCNGIDPFQILRLAEKRKNILIPKEFTDTYLSKDFAGQKDMLCLLKGPVLWTIFSFALDYLNLDINICVVTDSVRLADPRKQTRISILVYDKGLSSVVLPADMLKDRLTKMIFDETGAEINLPIHLKDYCHSRLRYWIDNAFLAQHMQSDREYVVRDNAVYPVDFKSTGVIETKKKMGRRSSAVS